MDRVSGSDVCECLVVMFVSRVWTATLPSKAARRKRCLPVQGGKAQSPPCFLSEHDACGFVVGPAWWPRFATEKLRDAFKRATAKLGTWKGTCGCLSKGRLCEGGGTGATRGKTSETTVPRPSRGPGRSALLRNGRSLGEAFKTCLVALHFARCLFGLSKLHICGEGQRQKAGRSVEVGGAPAEAEGGAPGLEPPASPGCRRNSS